MNARIIHARLPGAWIVVGAIRVTVTASEDRVPGLASTARANVAVRAHLPVVARRRVVGVHALAVVLVARVVSARVVVIAVLRLTARAQALAVAFLAMGAQVPVLACLADQWFVHAPDNRVTRIVRALVFIVAYSRSPALALAFSVACLANGARVSVLACRALVHLVQAP